MKALQPWCARIGMAILLFALVGSAGVSAQTLDKDSLAGMKWRLVGPFRGGRAEAVTGIPDNPFVYYFGAAAGGVWKTTNAGVSWTPIFDGELNPSIGAIAVAPSDPNVIYVGTGEPCLRGDITYGNGMYRSLDAGKTWTHIGLEDTRHISKVLINPHDPNIVYVAAIGHAFGPNEQRGVFRTTDGGKTWEKVLYKDDKTGAVDLTFAGGNSNVLYAALYQEVRKPWDIVSGGPGSGLYRSGDGGVTWKEMKAHGLPEGVLLGRIGLATSAAAPERVYALIEAEKDKGGVYVSNDAGDSWQLVTGDHRFLQRAFYYTHIFADPRNADTIYILNVNFHRSTDGGKTWATLRPPHGDNHALWIAPENSNRMITGDDGGAAISEDAGHTWTAEDNQPTAQFYHVAADNQFRYYLYGAQQDNSTMAIASSTNHGTIGRQDWYPVGGGESGYIAPDPNDAGVVYAGGNYGIITKWTKTTERRGTDHAGSSDYGWLGRGGSEIPVPVDGADSDFGLRSQHDVYRRAGAFQDDQPRAKLDGDQSGPDAQRQNETASPRRADHARQHERGILRHDFCRGGITKTARSDLGGKRRRAGAHYAGWRQELGGRDAERSAGVEQDQLDRSFAF